MITILAGLATVLVVAVGLLIFFAVQGIPELWVGALTTVGGRAILAFFSASFLGAASVFLLAIRERRVAAHAFRRPGPKGDVLVTPSAICQIAQFLIIREFDLTDFRIRCMPYGDGVALRIALSLPVDEETPQLAKRIQELLARSVTAKAGVPVEEVSVFVQGAVATPLELGEQGR